MTSSRYGVLAAVLVSCGLAAAAAPAPHLLAGEDAATVAALDTEYQAAVKRNDAATMDRILADDFVRRRWPARARWASPRVQATPPRKSVSG
jgi:hypothetical protein